MESVKEKITLILVTALITGLVSGGSIAVYFYFRTNFILEQYAKQWEDQKKKDENQDVETRLNTAEITGIKIQMAEFGTNMKNNTDMVSEIRGDVKKLLRKE